MSDEAESKLRAIPPTQRLLAGAGAEALRLVLGDDALRAELKTIIASLREGLLDGTIAPDRDALAERVDRALHDRARVASRRNLRPILNATGVVLHTNLGRAPLAEGVLDDVRAACAGYAPLEYDVEKGERGHRDRVVKELLTTLTGAEDAVVVNNCAAAVLLACTAFGAGREVIVSRGELVEIGGGFRIPDVIASCGATLVDVGTTNKTRVADFERACSERTGALLSVHPSNFAVLGFTQRPTRRELAELARTKGVPLLEDLGSGALIALERYGLPHEPTAQEAIEGGADVVMFSGDKLLGGPQAGILVGRATYIERLRKHPLMRALRPGRIVMAALEATLARYAAGRATREIPALRALTEPVDAVRARADALVAQCAPLLSADTTIEARASIARVGGGTLPLAEIPSFAAILTTRPPSRVVAIERALRTQCEPPVVGRLFEDALWLDARTLGDGDVPTVGRALARALSESHNGTQHRLESEARGAPPGVGSAPEHDE
ncbi:MAG: L-seryl-tRNA(Sec) selenium transferase [Polyangiales bacterium]